MTVGKPRLKRPPSAGEDRKSWVSGTPISWIAYSLPKKGFAPGSTGTSQGTRTSSGGWSGIRPVLRPTQAEKRQTPCDRSAARNRVPSVKNRCDNECESRYQYYIRYGGRYNSRRRSSARLPQKWPRQGSGNLAGDTILPGIRSRRRGNVALETISQRLKPGRRKQRRSSESNVTIGIQAASPGRKR